MAAVITNQILNPSFEAGITTGGGEGAYGWGSGSVALQSADPLAHGTKCVEITASGSGDGGQYYQSDTATGDRVFGLDAWLVSGAANWVMEVRDNTFSLLASTAFTATTSGSRIVVPLASMGSHTQLRIALTRASAAASVLRFDAVQAQSGLVASAYFDGDTADTAYFRYDWTGTTRDSTSTRTVIGEASQRRIRQEFQLRHY